MEDATTILQDLNRLLALMAESRQLQARIHNATEMEREAISQRIDAMQRELDGGKIVECDRSGD